MAIDCEPEEDGEGEDAETSLGSFDRMIDQSKSWRKGCRNPGLYGWAEGVDLEQDDSDYEDADPAELSEESGIADPDGLLEQIGWNDNQPTVMA